MISNGRIKTEQIEVSIKNLPDRFDNLRIIHLSDIHIKKFGKREKRVVQIVNELNPDVLFLTGDIICRNARDEVEKFLWGIKTKYGIWAVQGNQEYRCSMTGEKMRECYQKYGVKLLINESDRLCIQDNFIGIVGVDDPFTCHDNLGRALAGIPEDSLKILLSHSPKIVDEATEKGISLVLSGHTHGGQFVVPGFGSLVRPKDWCGYVSGKYRNNGTQVYVNRGIGTSTIPLRLFCPSEIALIRLKKDHSHSH